MRAHRNDQRHALGLFAIAALVLILLGCGANEMPTEGDLRHDDSDAPFEVRIEIQRDVEQGKHCYVPVVMDQAVERLGGFDLMFVYDASAVVLTNVAEGQLYDCGWEYFDFTYGPGICPGWPVSGTLRVRGIAETDDGPWRPDFDCTNAIPTPYTLFTLDFLVSDDRTLEGMWIPLRFLWCDCDDNTISFGSDGRTYVFRSGVSRYVFDPGPTDAGEYIEDPVAEFPGYYGTPSDCLEDGLIRYVDFTNGGLDIVEADSIDVPRLGDFDCDGVPYTFADLVLFRDFFVYGEDLLGDNRLCAYQYSDVNQDGRRHTVADLQYQSRIFTGDALPIDSLPVDRAEVAVARDGTISVDSPMGAASMTVLGDITPVLLADSMSMLYAFDGDRTRVLIHSLFGGTAFDGPFVQISGTLSSITLSTPEGVLCDSVVYVDDAR